MNETELDQLARRAVLILAEGVEQLTARTAEQVEQHRQLLGELYQVLGALDAGAKVLDQVSAAIHGLPLPHATLLPYTGGQSCA